MKNKEHIPTCATCKHYNECLITGFESCKLGKEIPTSKIPCENYSESHDIK